MKRIGNLWPQIVAFDNLLQASRQAQKGKRFRDNVLAFNYNLSSELTVLQTELSNQTYEPGTYKTFKIRDPKPRLISAAPYRDRVVHHALCNIVMPVLDRCLIHDTYANRPGFGTHRALRRFTKFARSSKYVLKCDLKKYFPSIDHIILKRLIRRKIKCQKTLWLIDTIIDGSNEQESVVFHFQGDDLLAPVQRRRGLPIGNLTSQYFANYYLSGFDHFIKEHLQIRRYLRYVDDYALFSDDCQTLHDARLAIEYYLSQLRLVMHPVKSQLFETRHGVNFVGFRVLPDQTRVCNYNLRKARRRCRQLQAAYAVGEIDVEQWLQSVRSWDSHLRHGDTYRLRQQIFQQLTFSRP